MRDVYYHGGPRGLSRILPPAATGAKSCSAYVPARLIHNENAVYVTTDFNAAEMYAAGHRNGCVYQVSPTNLRPDPDCSKPGLSFECDSAEIIARHRISGKRLHKIRRVLVCA